MNDEPCWLCAPRLQILNSAENRKQPPSHSVGINRNETIPLSPDKWRQAYEQGFRDGSKINENTHIKRE